MIINAKDILTAEMMSNFLSNISANDEITVVVGDFSVKTNKNGLKDVWKSNTELKAFFEQHQLAEFDLISSNGNMMVLTYYDYTWWLESTRRINKLFKCLEDTIVKTNEATHTVACGFRIPGKVYGIRVFTGTMPDCIDFLNKELKRKIVRNTDNALIVMCISYVSGQKNVWKTFDELKSEGTIV